MLYPTARGAPTYALGITSGEVHMLEPGGYAKPNSRDIGKSDIKRLFSLRKHGFRKNTGTLLLWAEGILDKRRS